MSQAKIDKAIVGYIDILGYGKIVRKNMDNIEVIHWIENLIKSKRLRGQPLTRDKLSE
jgi:hypothetical protein